MDMGFGAVYLGRTKQCRKQERGKNAFHNYKRNVNSDKGERRKRKNEIDTVYEWDREIETKWRKLSFVAMDT